MLNKGNGRRFHRVDMPIRYFIVPSSPIRDREIYATGTNYFPKSTLKLIEAKKALTIQATNKIQANEQLVKNIFEEIIECIDFFGNCLKDITIGKNPKLDLNYWIKIKDHQKGFKHAQFLEETSPKTFNYIKVIEEKYLTFLNALAKSIENSSPTHFYVAARLPICFKVEEALVIFQSPKLKKVPLIQALLNLIKFMESYLDVYRRITDDNYLKQFPKEWPYKQSNVSLGGLAVFMNKGFQLYSKIDVLLYFESNNKLISFNGTVVGFRTIKDQERIAINFEFPNGHDQKFLQQEIQKHEVEECMHIPLQP